MKEITREEMNGMENYVINQIRKQEAKVDENHPTISMIRFLNAVADGLGNDHNKSSRP